MYIAHCVFPEDFRPRVDLRLLAPVLINGLVSKPSWNPNGQRIRPLKLQLVVHEDNMHTGHYKIRGLRSPRKQYLNKCHSSLVQPLKL